MFPRITGENKHSQVRKQTRSAAAQTVKPSRSSTRPCLHKTISAAVALHHVPTLASPLTSRRPPVPRYPHCTSPARTIADSNASLMVAPHWRRAGCSTSACTRTHTHTSRFKEEKSQQSECETSVGVALKQQLLSVSIRRGLAPRIRDMTEGQSRTHSSSAGTLVIAEQEAQRGEWRKRTHVTYNKMDKCV